MKNVMRCWNKCDVCGRFFSVTDLETGMAKRYLKTPDSDYSKEEFVTLCSEDAKRAQQERVERYISTGDGWPL